MVSHLAMVRDPGRLAALRKLALIDTAADEAFDRLARLAAKHLNTPVALVTLVEEDRQFFKSCLGLPEPWNSWKQTPLSHSFCQHVVESGEPLVIPDARLHPVLKDNPAIKDLGVVAYLGIPLVTSDRHVLGSFCVIDPTPRDWTKEHINVVRDFAALVMDEITLRSEARARQDLEEALRRQQSELEMRVQQRAEQLAKSEEKFSKAFRSSPDPITISSLEEGRYVDVNDAFVRLSGYSREEAIGRTAAELNVWIDPKDRALFVARLREHAPVRDTEVQFRMRSGEIRTALLSADLIDIDHTRSIITIIRDITERKKAEDDVRESEERYRLLFERNYAGVYRTTLEGEILDCNESFAHILGYATREEVMGRRAPDLYQAASDRSSFVAQLQQQGQLTNHETKLRRRDGTTAWILENVSLVRSSGGRIVIEGTAIDVSNYKQLEEQFWQAQKMEGIGRLAGGVAHDFNNLLSVITGYTHLLADRLEPSSPLRINTDNVLKAADRAASLIRQLLAFSRKQILAPRVLDLSVLVQEIGEMLPHLIGEDIELQIVAGKRIGHIKADPAQIEQVIMNLAVNARDAMPDGGKLILETANVELDEEYARTHSSVSPGDYVMLAISDTGSGMTEETKKHLFEPFYTTKEPGKGTGLGLSTIYGIVKQSGGNIWVYSEPGEGTTFKIYFPRAQEPLSAEERTRSSGSPLGTETVLLVEDEDSLRNLTRLFLESKGYKVLAASNGLEAIEIAKANVHLFDLLLTDSVMPGMSGRELAKHLQQTEPDLKVLFTSGYTDTAMIHNGTLDQGVRLVQKPFTLDELARAVRDCLDSAE